MVPFRDDSLGGTMRGLEIRWDRTPVVLRKLAKAEDDGRVSRRLLAIANALDGMDRKAAAEAAGMDRQTLRDWVIQYNEHGIDGLLDCWGRGRPPRLDPDEQAELYAIVLAGPDPEKDGICAYTREDRRLLVDAHYDRVVGRGQVETDHVRGFGGKLGIVALAPALAAAQINLLLAQRAPNILHVDIAERFRNQPAVPARKARRRRLVEHRTNALVRHLAINRRHARAWQVFQTGQPFTGKTAAPKG